LLASRTKSTRTATFKQAQRANEAKRTARQGKLQLSHKRCKTCPKCNWGRSQQRSKLTCVLTQAQAQQLPAPAPAHLETETNFETRHRDVHAAAF